MSGGHFDYNCFRISEFAEDLQREIDQNDDKTTDSWGNAVGFEFSKETIEKLQTVQKIIETAGNLAKETEWLYSGDLGEETYIRIVDEILEDFEI